MEFTDRKIFSYHNGATQVYGDPLALESNLVEQIPDLGGLLDKVNNIAAAQADPLTRLEGVQARRALIAGVRAAFQLVPFEPATGKGATDDHALGIYLAWVAFTQKKSGSMPTPPNTSPSTDSTAPTATPATTATTSASS